MPFALLGTVIAGHSVATQETRVKYPEASHVTMPPPEKPLLHTTFSELPITPRAELSML